MSTQIVCSSDDIDINDIKINKPYTTHDNRMIFNITRGSNFPLVFQTPTGYVPYDFLTINNNRFQIDIIISESKFVDLLQNIADTITNRISNKYPTSTCFPLYTELDNSSYKIRFRNGQKGNVRTFNLKREEIQLSDISKDDKIDVIFQIDKVVCSDKYTYFSMKILQIRKHERASIKNTESMFVDELDVYKRMVKMGVPIAAVKQKMLLAGVCPTKIASFSGTGIPPPPPLPPPPPPPMLFSVKQQPPPLAFLNDIKNGSFVLKKTNLRDKVLKNVKTNNLVPTLQDILDAKSKLKSGRTLYEIQNKKSL